jgi:hypothetical protein
MSDNRASVRWEISHGGEGEDQSLIIRASALGHPCMWELIASGQGIDPGTLPKNMARAFQEGHDAEPLIIRDLEEKYGFIFHSRQHEGKLHLVDNIYVMYHPDGVGIVRGWFLRQYCHIQIQPVDHETGMKAVFEIKNLSNSLWWDAVKKGVEETITEYPWQLSAMMQGEGLPGLWICRNKGLPPDKETGVKPYCEHEGKLHFQFVDMPFITHDEMVEKALLIKEGVLGEDLRTSDRPCDTPNHFPCRFLAVRPEPEPGQGRDGEEVGGEGMGASGVLHVSGEDAKVLDEDIRQYLFLKGQAKENKERQDAIRDRIIETGTRLLGRTPEEIQTDKWRVPVKPSYSSGYEWDKMSPELKRAVEKYKKKGKVTGHHVRDIERLDLGD